MPEAAGDSWCVQPGAEVRALLGLQHQSLSPRTGLNSAGAAAPISAPQDRSELCWGCSSNLCPPGQWSQHSLAGLKEHLEKALRDRVGLFGCLCRGWTPWSSWVPFQHKMFYDLHRQHILLEVQGISEHLVQDLGEGEQFEPTLTLKWEKSCSTQLKSWSHFIAMGFMKLLEEVWQYMASKRQSCSSKNSFSALRSVIEFKQSSVKWSEFYLHVLKGVIFSSYSLE